MKDVMDRYVYPGPGDQPRSTYGAITTDNQMKVIQDQIADAKEHKAGIITGDNQPSQDGRFYLPTLVTNLPDDAAMNNEETFGPIISIIAVDDEEEAIERANNTRFGLTASVWTENKIRGMRIARQMQTGVVSVNEHIISASTPEMPWGGVKASGYGRTRSIEGLLSMTVTQSLSYERFRLPFEPFWIPYTRLKRTFLRRFIHFWYGPTWRDKLKAFLR
jgi:acyl-CoA reductase-like NAD-dependent aldehyde dehydrogenase